jgi:hypothetical protein
MSPCENEGIHEVPSFNYFEKYCEIKRFLAANYYEVAGAGLALEGERFTKHSIDHVDDVIRQAGHLVGLGTPIPDAAYTKLLPYETYVFLLAILLHDAGNASGRSGHEKAPRMILEELGRISGLADVEKRLIASIAQAHGGRTTSGDKDTIANIVQDEQSNIGNIVVHGRRLAALVRLADELSENPNRADPETIKGEFSLYH